MTMLALFISLDAIKKVMQEQGWWGGALVSFALLFACGLGLPLPEDIPLVLSGALLCHDPNGPAWQEWAIVGFLNWAGIIGGDVCLYWIGRRYGQNVTRLPVIGKHVTMERIERVRGLFDKYGVGVVAVGRLLAGIRGAMVVTAGTIRFNFWLFLIADSLAAIVSGGMFMLLGWWIGDTVNDALIAKYQHYFIAGAGVLALGFVIYIVWRVRRHKTISEAVAQKMADKAESPAAPSAD